LESLPLDLPVVVTAKDWVKLRNRKDIDGRQFLIASQRLHVEPEAAFTAWVLERLHE
jgi:tetraacyldisaccharide 4'-kinase